MGESNASLRGSVDGEVPLTIVFADIGGSTRLYEELGDVEAHRLAKRCLEQIEQAVAHHRGRVIKTIGDEVMCCFASPDLACAAARRIQERASRDRAAGGVPGGLHIGLHYGLVLPEEGDVFGDAVNVAARMVGLARPGEILTTRETVEQLGPAERCLTRQIDHRSVKGRREEIDVYEVVWETLELTAVNPTPSLEEAGFESCLVLSMDDQEIELSPARRSITIGRSADNDLVVGTSSASRRHAQLELRQGKFVLHDQSKNGTLVIPREGAPILLRREELILPASGTIRIGEVSGRGGRHPIRFRLEPWVHPTDA